MNLLETAVRVDDDSVFSAIAGDAKEAVFEYRLTMPFEVSKEHKPGHDEDDVVVYGPVYVGDERMLDRHKELVDPEAIMSSWDDYRKNPVILYNHRKDYGVIGMMESVEMGTYETEDGDKIPAVYGRAVIDGGEENIARKVRKGMLRAFSIGFLAKAAVKEGNGDEAYLRFTNIEWIETSVVDIPASRNALFDVQKSLVSYDGEKHIIAVEERDGSYVVEFGKSEMDDEPAGPMEEVERSLDVDEVIALTDAIAALEAKLASLTEAVDLMSPIESVKSHVDGGTAMSDELLTEETELTEVEDLTVKEAPEEELFVLKTEGPDETLPEEEESSEEEVEEEAAEEAAEEPAEEEVVEEAEEEVAEEAPAEEAEEAEEEVVEAKSEEVPEDDDLTVPVMTEMVRSLSAVEATLASLIERLDETESLKAMVAERDATIESLTNEKAEAEKAAEVEATVAKRMTEMLAEVGLPVSEAKPKSLSPASSIKVEKTGVLKHDPQPHVSHGVAALGTWLEGRLGDRRLE